MICCGRLEDRVGVKVLHRYLDHTQYKHVRSSESAKPVHKESNKLDSTRDEASRTLCEPLQVSFGIGPKVEKTHEQTAHKEKGIDTKSSVCDSLEEKSLLHHLPILHIVRIFEDNNACMP